MRDDNNVCVSGMIYRVKCNSYAYVEKVISSIEVTLGKFLKVQLISLILQIYTHTNIIWWQFNVVYICYLLNSNNMGRAKYLFAGRKERMFIVL